jgi:hypothetical protein
MSVADFHTRLAVGMTLSTLPPVNLGPFGCSYQPGKPAALDTPAETVHREV